MRPRTRKRLVVLRRRLILWIVLPLAFLLTLRLAWGWEAAGRLAAVRAQLREAGVRFEPPAANAPDDNNPAAALGKAVEAFTFTSDEQEKVWGDGTVGWEDYVRTPAQDVLAHDIVERNQEAFAWVDEAARRGGPIPAEPAEIVSRLGAARQLSRALLLAMQLEHARGDDAAALRALQRMHVIANIVDHGGDLIHNLVAIAIRATMASGVEYMEPSLHLRAEDGSFPQAHAVLKMLNDPAPGDSVAWNFEQEIGKTAAFGEQYGGLNAWWIRPLRDDEVARTQQLLIGLVPGVRARNWADSNRLMAGTSATWAEINLNAIIHWSNGNALTTQPRIMTLHFRGRTDTLAAAVLLAARLRAAEHGALPKAVGELAPEYLPAAPEDPFSPVHAPLQFRIDAGGPTVWSVGENRTDEHAVVRFDGTGKKLRRYDNINPRSQADMIYGAAWRTPAPAPAAPPAAPITQPASMSH
jgi:hypothetical protein